MPSPKKASSASRDSTNDHFSASDIIAVSGLPITTAANFPFLVSSAGSGNLSIPVYGLLSSAAATGTPMLTPVYAAATATGQMPAASANISVGTVSMIQSGTTAIPPVMVTAGTGASTITWSPATVVASNPERTAAAKETAQPASDAIQGVAAINAM